MMITRAVALSVALTGAALMALGRGTTGTIEGRVTDKATGEPLVGVNVLVAGTTQGAATDADGFYRIANIKAGAYELRFSMVGYARTVVTNVTVLPDLRTKINVALEVAAVELETVEIRAERTLIQTDQAGTAYTISDQKIEALPIKNVTEVITLQPGVTAEGNVRGGRVTELLYLVDGLPIQDVLGGGLTMNLSKSSVSGMTIHTGGFDAEYGNAMSGVVNIITQSGGRTHDVSARYERDNWVPPRVSQQTNKASELEFTAGGPIVQDEAYYYGAFTMRRQDTRWWQDWEHFVPSPVAEELMGFGKIEWNLTQALRLSGQVLYSSMDWRDYEFSWRFNLGGLPVQKRDALRLSASLSHTLTPSSFYQVSASVLSMNKQINEGTPDASSLVPYQYDFYLRYVLEGSKTWWASSDQHVYLLKGEYTNQMSGGHILKAGFEILQYDVSSDVIKYEPQTTYFGKPILDAPLLNYSTSYRYRPRSGSVYIQDKIEVKQTQSNVSLGLRWDFLDPTASRPVVEFVPSTGGEYTQSVTSWTSAKFKHQLSPRFSFATPISPETFFFLNFGLYFQFPLFDYMYSGLSIPQMQSGTRSVLAGNPDLQPERTIAWEIGIKRSIVANIVGSITYFKRKSYNQLDSKTLIPSDSKFSGDYGYATYVNNAQATASGLEIVVSRERGEFINGSISYTTMTTEGIGETADQGINYSQWGFALPAVSYPLSWDQRHAVKADLDLRLPLGIDLALVVLYNSAKPYSYYPTKDGFTPANRSIPFVPNNKRMSEVTTVAMKLKKRFELSVPAAWAVVLYLDGANMLNAENVRWMDSNGRVGGELGDPGAYYDPRRVSLGFVVEL
jgi:outer membrane receptor for ferrienterochelin and colicin